MKKNNSARLFKTVIHPSISIALSVSFLIILTSVIENLVNMPKTGFLFILYLIVVGIGETVLGNILFSEHTQRGNRLREFFIILIFSYLVFSLLQKGPFLDRFYPGIIVIYRCIVVAAMWLITYSLHERFRVWELYLSLRASKSGEELKQYIRDSMVFIADVKKQLTVIKRNSTILLAILIIGVTILYIWQRSLPGSAVAALGVYLVLYFITLGMANTFIEEFYISGEGLRVPIRYTFRRLVSAAVLICVILLVGLLVASDRALLPVSLLERFFAWLSSLFQADTISMKPPEPVQPFQYDSMERFQQPMMLRDVKTYLFLEKLFAMIKKAAIVAGVTLAAILLFGPLFSENFRDYLRRMRLFQIAGSTIRRFLFFFREILLLIIDVIRKRQSIADIFDTFSGRRRVRERIERGGDDYSWIKRRELDRLTKQLVKIFRWAQKRGYPYHTTKTLEEYFGRLSSNTDVPRKYFETVRSLYEEARFSPLMLGRGKRGQFMDAVKTILTGPRAQ